jgi:tRNA A37 N6-isopentenylltransferase MiaA
MKRRTRILVRRQSNWFRKENADINWFDLEETATTEIISWVAENLEG